MTQRAELEKRLAEVNARISAYPYWGAALTALDEERRGLERAIANEQPAVPRDPLPNFREP